MMQRDFALPGTKARYPPDRQVNTRHIRIELKLDFDERSIEGTCTLTLAPIADAARWVELDAVEFDVSRVESAGEDLKYSHDGKLLRVDLGREHSRGKSFEITVHYSGSPRRGLYFVGPDDSYPNRPVQVWSQGQDEDSRYWFPCFDAPKDKASSEVIATVPKSFFALSNGSLRSNIVDGDWRTFHWRFDEPHSCYLITLVVGELSEIQDSWNNIDVNYYVKAGCEEHATRTLGRTPEMIQLFSDLFRVPYPYEKYAQVFVADFIFGGMENTTATTLTDVILLDERAAIDFDVESLVSHELAHQWFGDLLTCRDWSEGWLNEGFATYAEYLWREHADGRDEAALELQEWGEQYFTEDSSRYRRTVATNVYDEPIDIFDHHLYEKGGRILHMLRQVLGEESYWSSIQHYLTKHRTGSVETRDLARAVEDTTGRNLDWFFEQWITKGSGHPELKISYQWDPQLSLAKVTIEQTQDVSTNTPLFRVPTKLRFRVGDEDCDLDIELSEAQHSFFYVAAEEPQQMIFDPGKHILAQVTYTKTPAMWISELEDATEAIDRVYAARELAKVGGGKAHGALYHALTGDPFWGVRAAAAASLGDLRTAGARDALVEALDTTEHPRARRAVVRALGEFRSDEHAASALIDVIEVGDESYFVEAEACLSLGRTRSTLAPSVLRSVLNRDSFTDIIRQCIYRGLAEARDDTAINLLLDATRYGGVSHGRRAAVSALGQLIRGRKDREAVEVGDHLRELLRDPDFRVQSSAIEALATAGDPDAVPALQALADRDLDGRLRRRAREIIRDLQEGRSRDEQITALREETDKLRTALISTIERLERLETTGVGSKRTRKKTAGKKKKAASKSKKGKLATIGRKGKKNKKG